MIEKPQLVAQCLELVDSKILELNQAFKALQEAANLETKSSMGDKYETGRSMIMQEKEKLSGQLQVLKDQRRVLEMLKPEEVRNQVQLGSMVVFGDHNYFISVALGKIDFGQDFCFAISPVSPIGKILMGRKKEDVVDWRGQSIIINDLY